jgi:hypothetical protein
MIPHPEKGVRKPLHEARVQKIFSMLSGGLRSATTTGYYLTAFQAEIRWLPRVYLSFSYGIPSERGGRDDPMKPAKTIIVRTYGTI